MADSVSVVDNERLDIPDFNALQSLIYSYIEDVVGSLVGGTAGGVLSQVSFDTAEIAKVKVGECTILLAQEENSLGLRARGRILKHDPTLPNQSSILDLSPYVAGSGTPYIWARRAAVAMDLATRRKWSAGAEVSFTHTTRTRSRTQFAVAVVYPPGGETDWTKIAQVTGWSSGSPTIRPIHAFDLTIDPVSNNTRRLGSLLGSRPMVGLARIFTEILSQLRTIVDDTGASSWNGVINRGLLQLHEDLAAAEADIVTNAGGVAAINSLLKGRHILAQGSIEMETSSEINYTSHTSPKPVGGTQRNSAGNYTVVVNGNATAVNVTPKDSAYGVAGVTLPIPKIGNMSYDSGAHTTTFTVTIRDQTGALVDQSFYFVVTGAE